MNWKSPTSLSHTHLIRTLHCLKLEKNRFSLRGSSKKFGKVYLSICLKFESFCSLIKDVWGMLRLKRGRVELWYNRLAVGRGSVLFCWLYIVCHMWCLTVVLFCLAVLCLSISACISLNKLFCLYQFICLPLSWVLIHFVLLFVYWNICILSRHSHFCTDVYKNAFYVIKKREERGKCHRTHVFEHTHILT